MIEYNNTAYFSKEEIKDMLHCSICTVNNKISKSGIKGRNFGRLKYYTEEQIDIIADCRTYQPKEG